MDALADLTIIVPSFNTKALLRQCLSSIYRYTTGIRVEVIVDRDGSSDGEPGYDRVGISRGYPGAQSGAAALREEQQSGYEDVRARYACLLNSDTKLLANGFSTLVKFMDSHPDASRARSSVA